ncbi:hypothetical protein GCM10029992_40550 [Glycomyces albus]
MEDLHGRLEFVVGDGHDVAVDVVGEDDDLLLDDLVEGRDVVAQSGGLLEVEVLGGGLHLGEQPPADRGGVAGHEGAEAVDEFAVLLGGDAPDARGRALADVGQEIGAADPVAALEFGVGAGADREDAGEQVEGLANRPGRAEGAEIAHALAAGAAHDLGAGNSSPTVTASQGRTCRP